MTSRLPEFIQIFSGTLSLLFTGVVAAGLIFEYKGSKSTNRTDWSPWTGNPPKYWDMERIGDFLIVVGVVGEFFFGAIALRVASNHDTSQRREISKLVTRNLGLEQILQPRHISALTSSESLVMALRKFAGTPVLITSVQDLAALRLAVDIGSFLKDACGWSVTYINAPMPLVSQIYVPSGVQLLWHWSDDPKKHGEDTSGVTAKAQVALFDALVMNKPRIWATQGAYPPAPSDWWPDKFEIPKGTIFVFVGMKPVEEEMSLVRSINKSSDKARDFFQQQMESR